MWTRKELKTKAKASLRRNYWKTVLIALVFTLVCGGASSVSISNGAASVGKDAVVEEEVTTYDDFGTEEDTWMFDEMDDADTTDIDNPSADELTGVMDARGDEADVAEDEGTMISLDVPGDVSLSAVFAITGVVFLLIAGLLAIALTVVAFVVNPIEVGTARFFTRNLNQAAEVKELAYGFDHNYRESVKTMFWRDVRIILWGLLFVVPGVIKSYEYRMIPYLLADDPTMTKDQAFAQSKAMMNGNKWRAFVLDLSFIGWYLLALPTLGLVTVFYASPYKKMTDAALYEELRYGSTDVQDNAALPAPVEPVSDGMQVPVPPFAAADTPAPVWDDEPADEPAADEPVADKSTVDEPADSASPDDSVVAEDPQA